MPIRIALIWITLLLCRPMAQAQNTPPSGAMWIWATTDAATPDTIFVRHRFRLPQKPLQAKLQIVADDLFSAFLNESAKPIATGNDWTTVQEFDITAHLKSGTNLLAIEATNTVGAAGLLYKILATLPNGQNVVIASNQNARIERRPPPIWTTFALDDKDWQPAREVAPANGGVWGALKSAPIADPSRIIRLWNTLSAASPESNVYSAPRNIGDRMLLTCSVASPSEMNVLTGTGFTLFQTDSNHLSTNETAPNFWDWGRVEGQRKTVQLQGQDWAYFPHFAFPPAWYRNQTPFTRIQCLEHQRPVQAFSPWEPKWAEFVEHGYDALAKEFGEAGKSPRSLSAICVGVHGDYGEAGLLLGGRVALSYQKEDWQKEFGDLHNHLGFWCHDPLARAHFRDAMLQKYGGLDRLNAAWKRTFKKPEEIVYPEKPRAEARREWLDFMQWYKQGVSSAIDINLSAARKRFPNTLLMVPAGFIDEDPRGGNDNSLIAKTAARYQAEVRSTHSAYKPFAENAATMFARIASACRFYNVPFWAEPQSGLTAEQETARLFEAISQGAKGVFDWASNALRHREIYYRYGKHLKIEKPIVDVAMYYPAEAQQLRSDQGYHRLFAQSCAFLRDMMNFDIVDDRMIRDGCLSRYRILALWEGTLAEPETLAKIKSWVNDGGTLLAYDFDKITTFEGDSAWFEEMFGYRQQLQRARVNERYVGDVPAHYRLNVAAPEVSDYLGGEWFEPEARAGRTGRWIGASASLLLPVTPEKRYSLIIRARVPQEAEGLKRRVLLNGREIGTLITAGDVTYRFLISADALQDQPLSRLSFQSQTFQPAQSPNQPRDPRRLAFEVQSIELQELDAKALANPQPPSGTVQRELDLRQLNGSWARRFGKGLTIYFPGKRSLLRGYLEVVRRATYNLSSIDPRRRNALPIDLGQDGVYATLFTDKILFYNSTGMPVSKTLSIPAAAFAEWRGEITMPAENSWKLNLEPHSIGAIHFAPTPQEMLFECEEFTDLGGQRKLQDPLCSPGSGDSCVRIAAQSAISTRFRIETPGTYALYVRCLRNNKLEPVEALIDDQPVTLQNLKAGKTLLCATISLAKGSHKLTLRTRAKREVRADFVILTNDATVSGYDFAVRIPPVE